MAHQNRFHFRSIMDHQSHCLVTGAAGFIGSHLVDALLERGARVTGVDNLKLGKREHLALASKNPAFKFFHADINDLAAMEKIIAAESDSGPFDTVWHLAANSDIRAGVEDPDVDYRDTFLTTHSVLKLMRQSKIRAIAFASTSAIYGALKQQLSEDTGPLFPISSYGAMKLASEAAISAAAEAFLQRAWIFRFPNVVGSRPTHGAIFDFIQKLERNPNELEVLGDGTQQKPYLHVADLVEAMLFIASQGKEKINYFNVGPDDAGATVRYMAETTVREASPTAKIRYTGGDRGWVGDVPKVHYSIEKIRSFGWSPRSTSNQAVERAVKEILAGRRNA